MPRMYRMNKYFRFNILAFCIAFVVGLIFVYIDSPKQREVIKYPTPYNSNKLVYRSTSENCYKIKAEEVKCTTASIQQPII